MHTHFISFPHKDNVMPGAQSEADVTNQEFIGFVAIGQNELVPSVGAIGPADPQVVAARGFIAIRATGKNIAGDRTRVRGKTIPEPEFNRIAFWKGKIRANS